MKVLQINCVYGTGSTGKIAAEIHSKLLDSGITSIVCYGRGKRQKQENIYKTCGELYSKANHLYARMRGQLYGGCTYSTAKLLSVINREKPDVVHLQCINGYFVNIPRLVGWLKKKRIKTVLTLHAEFMFTANCGHAKECERWRSGCGKCPQLKTDIGSFGIDGTHKSWKKMKTAFDGFQEDLVVVSVSSWLMKRAVQSPILGDMRQEVVLNGLDTKVFYHRETGELRRRYPEDAKIVLFVTTKLTADTNDLKGGRYVMELAKKLKNEQVIILVAGDYDETLDFPSNMVMLGRLENQEVLAQYYSMADVTIVTSKRETFSMVTAESLCCGTPVAGFEAGGPESIALPEFSSFVEQGNVEALKEAVLKMLHAEINYSLLEEKAGKTYSSERMTREYVAIYQSLIERQTERQAQGGD